MESCGRCIQLQLPRSTEGLVRRNAARVQQFQDQNDCLMDGILQGMWVNYVLLKLTLLNLLYEPPNVSIVDESTGKFYVDASNLIGQNYKKLETRYTFDR